MIFEQFSKIGIIPIAVLNDPKDAAPLAEILCKNGLPCVEIAFRTPAAEESVRVISHNFPDILIGAGTIITTEDADRAMNAGATFIVSPGLNPKVVQHCIDNCVPIIPGAMTPSEMQQALELGLKVVRFFPAEQAGGLAMLKAVSEVFIDLKFMPAGGLNAKNVRNYLAYDRIVACGGSWMLGNDLIVTEKLVKESAAIVKEVRGKKVKCPK